MTKRLITAVAVLMVFVAAILPTTAAAHYTVMKPGTRFWVVTRPPKPTPDLEHQIGDKFNPYAICRHGIRGHPRTDPAFTTLGGYPLRFNGRGSPPTQHVSLLVQPRQVAHHPPGLPCTPPAAARSAGKSG